MTPALILVVAGTLMAAEPSGPAWQTLHSEVQAEVPGALGRLMALTAANPGWTEGRRVLAEAHYQAGKYEAALASARLAAGQGDVLALAVEIRALGALHRAPEAYAAAEAASDRDTAGWLCYEAGLVAVAAGDQTRARRFLADARSRSAGRIPAEFLYLESRIAVAAADYPAAERALAASVALRADFATGWYDLGRVRIVLADRDGENAADLLVKASEAMTTAATLAGSVPAVQLGVARAAWLHGRTLVRIGQEPAAPARFTVAQVAAREVLRHVELAEAAQIAGDCAYRLGQWSEAIAALNQARRLGVNERTVDRQLAMAQRRQQQVTDLAAASAEQIPPSPSEDLVAGLEAFAAQQWSQAHQRLRRGASGATLETVPAAWRMAGVAAARQAEATSLTVQDADRWRDLAREAWITAAEGGDSQSRSFLLVQEAGRDPEAAAAAGWRHLAWTGYSAPEAWKLVLVHHRHVATGGQGMWGWFTHRPLEAVLWLTAVLVAFGWWAWGRWRPRHVSSTYVNTATSGRMATGRSGLSGRQPVAAPAPSRSARVPVVTPRNSALVGKSELPPPSRRSGPQKIASDTLQAEAYDPSADTNPLQPKK